MSLLHACKLEKLSLVKKYISDASNDELSNPECYIFSDDINILDCLFNEYKKRDIGPVNREDICRVWYCALYRYCDQNLNESFAKLEYLIKKSNEGMIEGLSLNIFDSKKIVRKLSTECLLTIDHPNARSEIINRKNKLIIVSMLILPRIENSVKIKRTILDINAIAIAFKYLE